jgi:hypothetical protein
MPGLQQHARTTAAMAQAVWRQRWTFVTAGVSSVVFYHVLLLLLLSRGLTEPPTYFKVYNVPQNILTIWRATPALTDSLRLIDNEAVFEFGRTTSLFKDGKAVLWNYVTTLHVLGDTGLIFCLLTVYITLVAAVRREAQGQRSATCPGTGRAVLSATWLGLIGAGTGAACCGTISVGLLATLLGATATMTARLARYEPWLIVLGYLLLGSSLVHQGYRLYQLSHGRPALATAGNTPTPRAAVHHVISQ